MFQRVLVFSILIPSAGGYANGQVMDTLVPTGYAMPVPVGVAPGQILNIFVRGIGAGLSGRVAATELPLPTTLAGISVTIAEPGPYNLFDIPQPPYPESPVPIFAVAPVSGCNEVVAGLVLHACENATMITVQIPFWLVPDPVGPFRRIAELTVSENDAPVVAFIVRPHIDQIHVVDGCDAQLLTAVPPGGGCRPGPVVTHPDGSLVSSLNQAKPGEELVIYTLGLGVTTPAVKEGEASPTPAATVSVGLDFDFSPNAGPSTPSQRRDPGTPPLPVFAGLSPGSAGLYQVNFVVPIPPPGTPACFGTVHSNLTVSVIGANSTDGVGICVTSSDGTH
jgi:hypothetical protein